MLVIVLVNITRGRVWSRVDMAKSCVGTKSGGSGQIPMRQSRLGGHREG